MFNQPSILTRLIEQIMDTGTSASSARAIATRQLQRNGILIEGTQRLTDLGKVRDSMSAEDRAIDRHVMNGGSSIGIIFNPDTNRVTKSKTINVFGDSDTRKRGGGGIQNIF